jgi:hypothetical protein
MEAGQYKIFTRNKETGEKIFVGIVDVTPMPEKAKKPKKEGVLKLV